MFCVLLTVTPKRRYDYSHFIYKKTGGEKNEITDLRWWLSPLAMADSCCPTDSSTPGLPVLHCLPQLAQGHIHWVADALHRLILCGPLLLLPSVFPSIRVFSNELVLSGGQSNLRLPGHSRSTSIGLRPLAPGSGFLYHLPVPYPWTFRLLPGFSIVSSSRKHFF